MTEGHTANTQRAANFSPVRPQVGALARALVMGPAAPAITYKSNPILANVLASGSPPAENQ